MIWAKIENSEENLGKNPTKMMFAKGVFSLLESLFCSVSITAHWLNSRYLFGIYTVFTLVMFGSYLADVPKVFNLWQMMFAKSSDLCYDAIKYGKKNEKNQKKIMKNQNQD